jgi:uncharacterized membrane protein YkoI
MAWSKLAATAVTVPALLGSGEAATNLEDVSAARACLERDQRRAMIASGQVVKLSTAVRRMHRRVRGEVIRARLCRAPDGLAYRLTVLARDGKVVRLTVDAVSGKLIGGE